MCKTNDTKEQITIGFFPEYFQSLVCKNIKDIHEKIRNYENYQAFLKNFYERELKKNIGEVLEDICKKPFYFFVIQHYSLYYKNLMFTVLEMKKPVKKYGPKYVELLHKWYYTLTLNEKIIGMYDLVFNKFHGLIPHSFFLQKNNKNDNQNNSFFSRVDIKELSEIFGNIEELRNSLKEIANNENNVELITKEIDNYVNKVAKNNVKFKKKIKKFGEEFIRNVLKMGNNESLKITSVLGKNWEERFSKTILFFLLLNTDEDSQGWDYLYYIISQGLPFSPSTVVSLGTKNLLSQEAEHYLQYISNLIGSSLGMIEEEELYKTHALRSAVAAIMARNMSHNIGSHVLANTGSTEEILGQKDIQIFNRYLQQRMDFIAQISTDFPEWSFPCWFYRDLMRNFYMQKLILNYISSSEGLAPYEYDKDKKQFQKLKINFKSNKNDAIVSIPGGIVGQHAFYVILEDIIRNSAKHNWATLSESDKNKKNLEITVKIQDKPDDGYVEVCIFDNISEIRRDVANKELPNNIDNLKPEDFEKLPLHQKMNYYLIQPLIDETGKLKRENWGLAEMKICAGYLQKKKIEEIGNGGEHILNIIKAIAVNDNGSYRLGYTFKIYKPKEVLIIENEELLSNKDELRNYSIYVEKTMPQEIDYEFLVLYDDGNNEFIKKIKNYTSKEKEVKKEIESLPYRLFIVSDELKKENGNLCGSKWLGKRIVILSKNEVPKFDNSIEEKAKTFKLFLYNKWCEHLSGLRNIEIPVEILIKVKGEEGKGKVSKRIEELLNGINPTKKDEITQDFGLDENYQPPTLPRNLISKPDKEQMEPWNEKIEPRNEGKVWSIKIQNPLKKSTEIYLSDKKIIYARHKDIDNLTNLNCFYFESLTGIAPHFLQLAEPPQDDYNMKKLLFQLVENGLIRIGIADERVAQSSVLTSVVDGLQYNEYLRAAQIFVIKKFLNYEIPNVSLRRFLKLEENSPKNGILVQKFEEIKNGEKREENLVGDIDLDFLIVHQGVIDKLNKTKDEIEKIIDSLKEKISFIVVTSGRGEPPNIPDNVKYLPFANIESTIITKPHSKFILTQILMNLIRKHNGKIYE